MGREVVRVPPGFEHPLDEEGGYIAGGHHELLYDADPASRTAFQIYENVSEGTPVSPVFETAEALAQWLRHEGWEQEAIDSLLEAGHAPSFIVRS
ncbi:hypothetical protein C1922_18920 [Stenotrophomonas sp. ZAC14D2_NAIMI4_7]|uniref:hypothetical protein n=1 Tax=Stenotrophomonas sp. ZAC14D2_NAIMI4_7 TaxID=2072405 RepID=UPI000D53FD76|nr:hypothetical protein [Stenotrophomonas sp. ZAC14D2_NAIMI4_7]AWH19239.1 hypothetical protein C1922_18920 [Stenotrophomonas sp. ZAC14D2_NAIMI4_7]